MNSKLFFLQSGEDVSGAQRRLGEAIMAAQPGAYKQIRTPSSYNLYRCGIPPDRVAVIVSGGGGTGPLFPGFAGPGLADAAIAGDFDTAPSAYTLYEMARTIHQGRGVLILTNKYTGDFLNNDMAQELLRTEHIDSRVCYANEDIFGVSDEPIENRGGMFGVGILVKVAAAAADAGLDLDEVYRITRKAADRMRCVTVRLNEDTNCVEFGAGFSGEEPKLVFPYRGMEDMAARIEETVMKELAAYSPKAVSIAVNRMQVLTFLEGLAIMNSLKKHFEKKGYRVSGCSAGGYFSAFFGPGCIVTVSAPDDELLRYMPVVKGYDFTI
ncbi:MAG: dihydroxyacetone kinase subunit DhaK [Treponema sp.]|jgi:dihydroxyacetone kinase|nr:dihydroxyacetone kinase subunit DhaK [Treponema sp.]